MSPSSFAARLHALPPTTLMLIIGASAFFFLFVLLVLLKTPALSCNRRRKHTPKSLSLLPTIVSDLTWPSPPSALPNSKAASPFLGISTLRNLTPSLRRLARMKSADTATEDLESRLPKERPHTFIPQHWPRTETPLSSRFMTTWQDHKSRTSSSSDSSYSVDASIEDRLTTFVPRRAHTLGREDARPAMFAATPLSTPETTLTRIGSKSRSPLCTTDIAPSPSPLCPPFAPVHTRNRHRLSNGIPLQWRMKESVLRTPATRATLPSMNTLKRTNAFVYGAPGLLTPPATPIEPTTPMPIYWS